MITVGVASDRRTPGQRIRLGTLLLDMSLIFTGRIAVVEWFALR